MYIKVFVEDRDSSSLPLFFSVLENPQLPTRNIRVEFICHWKPDYDRDDILSSWISDHQQRYKDIKVTYYTHSTYLDEISDQAPMYEVNTNLISLDKISQRQIILI